MMRVRKDMKSSGIRKLLSQWTNKRCVKIQIRRRLQVPFLVPLFIEPVPSCRKSIRFESTEQWLLKLLISFSPPLVHFHIDQEPGYTWMLQSCRLHRELWQRERGEEGQNQLTHTLSVPERERERESDRQTGKQADRRADRQAETYRDKETGKERERRETDRSN